MAKKLNIAVIDTETASLHGNVYDIGVVFTNRKGEVLHTYESIVLETFTDARTMEKAHYFRKIDSYYNPRIRTGSIEVKSWNRICAELAELFHHFNINAVAAYNMGFDRRVIEAMHRKYGGEWFLLQEDFKYLKTIDLWRVSAEKICDTRNYCKFAMQHGLETEKGGLSTTAESVYRYITQDPEFIESHTALDDAMIETEILAECYRRKGKFNYGLLAGQPWRIPRKRYMLMKQVAEEKSKEV